MAEPPRPPALFTLDGVSLEIDGATVLGGVTLTIPDDGITVVVGPSGAGKSMLLRLLNRLEVPTAGEVRFRGVPVSSLDPLALRRAVGMVFQRPAPFPGTVRENLAVADPTAGDAAYVEALERAGLDSAFLDRSADDLSGGEAQRMCLARTLVTRPEALLMDEPTSALDPDARRRLERTARRLADGGRPVVWVTHDLDQCRRLADAVIVMVGGHVATDEERHRYLADRHDGTGPGGDDDGETVVDDAAIGWGGLGLSFILVAVAIGLSMWQGLRLERDMLWASGRAIVQLLAVGWLLTFIVDDDTPIIWAWAWVVVMLAVAALTARRRAPEVPGITRLTFGATSASAALSLFVVFGLGVYPVVGRAVVPIAGMMIGNSIGSIVVAARRILGELADRRPEVEARLALGQPWQEASKPFVRSALRTALTSQIESTKAVGLVFLPGAMTGLILAGADPVDAVLVQAAIMYLILGCVATNVVVIGLGLTRRLFTPDHRLVRLARTGR